MRLNMVKRVSAKRKALFEEAMKGWPRGPRPHSVGYDLGLPYAWVDRWEDARWEEAADTDPRRREFDHLVASGVDEQEAATRLDIPWGWAHRQWVARVKAQGLPHVVADTYDDLDRDQLAALLEEGVPRPVIAKRLNVPLIEVLAR